MKYNFCLTRKYPISGGSKPVEANWRELRPAILLVCHLLFTLPLPLLTLDFHIPHSLGGITIYR